MSSRMLNDDDVSIHVAAREFVPIESIDQTLMERQEQEFKPVPRAFFTVGVVVDV